jgi:hypothetical protein
MLRKLILTTQTDNILCDMIEVYKIMSGKYVSLVSKLFQLNGYYYNNSRKWFEII